MTEQEIAEQCRQITREFSAWVDPLDLQNRRSIELFCGLVLELENYSLFRDLLQHSRIDWRLKIEDGKVVSALIEKLNETDLSAFAPLARLFTLKKELASIRKIGRIFDERVSRRHPLWWKFNAYREGLDQFLALTAPNLPETFGELFDIFINGHYVHRDDAKEAKYEFWKRDAGEFTTRKVAFLLALGSVFSHVRSMRDFARQLLEGTVNSLHQPRPGAALAGLPRGITKPLFSNVIAALDLDAVPQIANGQRISICEPFVDHLVEFLGDAVAPHIRAGNIGEVKVHEYGAKMGDKWIDRHIGISLLFPASWTTVDSSPGLRLVTKHVGRPSVFLTQEFFSYLKRATDENYQWELAPASG